MAENIGTDHRLALSRLRGLLIDPERFSTDGDVLSGYLEPGTVHRRLVAAAFPRSSGDVRGIVECAREGGLSVYTPLPWGLNPPRDGVVVDFRFMSRILGVDTRNLFLDVEPGVTWEQVLPVLAERGVRVALPASARSPYVLESALEREVVLAASRFSNRQLATFHAVLADGREYRSGSDALPASTAHWREDGGPNLSRLFTGSRNSFGIPVRGFVYLYPEPEERKVVALGFGSRKRACLLARRAARSEIGTEVVVLNRLGAGQAAGGTPGLPAWSAVFGLEGSFKLVSYHEKRLGELASELGLEPSACAPAVSEALSDALGRPWYAPPLCVGFYTTFDRLETLAPLCEKPLRELGRVSQVLIPVKRGASVYVQYGLEARGDRGEAAAAVKGLLPGLADAGAFFPNPAGPLAWHIFKKQPRYYDLLRKVKGFMDPLDILNTGQVLEV